MAASTSFNAWHARAEELAAWTCERLVNRTDAWGGYTTNGPITKPAVVDRGKIFLSIDLIERHFRATQRDHIVGLHSGSPGPAATAKWIGIDIDKHSEAEDARNNLDAAVFWLQEARALGFDPLLTGSNGDGGFHLRILFRSPIDLDLAYRFGNWLVRSGGENGLPIPEVFPKQRSLADIKSKEEGKFGSWLRIPGRHHKRDYWSTVRVGHDWADGAKAVEHILSLAGDDPKLIPPEANAWTDVAPPPPKTDKESKTWNPSRNGLSPGDDFDRNGPDWDKILEPHGGKLQKRSGDVCYFCRPGKHDGTSVTTGRVKGDHGEPLLRVFTTNAPPFEEGGKYGRFRAYAILSHNADLSAAARKLMQDGFGSLNGSNKSDSGKRSENGDRVGQFDDSDADPTPDRGDAWEPGQDIENPPPSATVKSNKTNDKRTIETAAIFKSPVPISHLTRPGPQSWIWEGFLKENGITLFSALWKVGKTTLLSRLLLWLQRGGEFLGKSIRETRVLYVTEEDDGIWADRRDALGIQDSTHVLTQPFRTKPPMRQWTDWLNYIEKYALENQIGLIVLDTISSVWPIKNENDAGEVQEALMPLRTLAAGRSIVIIHHLKKFDNGDGTGSRGSGALQGFVDVITEMRRFKKPDGEEEELIDQDDERRRVLTSVSRWTETPKKLVIMLKEDGSDYIEEGDGRGIKQAKLVEVLKTVLPTGEPGLMAEQIRERLPKGTAKLERVRKELLSGAVANVWRTAGTGRKGDPRRFWKDENLIPFPAIPTQGTEF